MSRTVLSDAQGDFRGGLNLTADPLQLAPNEVRRADEAVLTEYGGITKRLGTQRLNNSVLHATGVQNGFAWLKDDGTQQLLAVANGTLYTASYGLGNAWTSQSGSLATTGAPSFASFRAGSSEVVYIADGGTPGLNKWNGTTLTTNIASTPAVTQLAVYNQRLFGVAGNNQTIYWSALNNGDSLGLAGSGGGEAIIRTFGDQNIVGIAPFGSSLLVFHVSGISRFTGLTQDDIAIASGAQGVTGDVGAIAPRSIVSTERGVFFLSDRGFFVCNETTVENISLKIQRVVQDLNLSQSTNVVGIHVRATKEVLYYLPSVGVYRYNYALGAWTGPCVGGLVSPATTAYWEAQDAEKQPIVLMGDASGYVKQTDAPAIYKDNAAVNGTGGTAYTFAVQCRRLYAGDPAGTKSFKWLYLLTALRGANQAGVQYTSQLGGGTATLSASGSTGAWGIGTWGSGVWSLSTTTPVRVPIDAQGPYLDVLLTDGSTTTSLWSRVELEAFDYGRRF